MSSYHDVTEEVFEKVEVGDTIKISVLDSKIRINRKVVEEKGDGEVRYRVVTYEVNE